MEKKCKQMFQWNGQGRAVAGGVGASRPRVGRKARRRAWLSQCGNTRQLGGRYRARPHLPQIPTTLGALRPRKSASAPLSVFCQILNCWFLLAPVVNECTAGPAMRAVVRACVDKRCAVRTRKHYPPDSTFLIIVVLLTMIAYYTTVQTLRTNVVSERLRKRQINGHQAFLYCCRMSIFEWDLLVVVVVVVVVAYWMNPKFQLLFFPLAILIQSIL